MRKLKLLLLSGFLFAVQLVGAQKKAVTGKVTDPVGTPLYGISVLEKGTRNGTTTAPGGTFSLTVNPNAKLVISAVGFETKEVPAGDGNLVVQLAQDTRAMSEVVVTGTGVATSKRKLGISVETVITDKTTPVPTASVDEFLVGKVAGAQNTSANGSPGQPVNILLRGINTLNRGTSPIILMDGVELGATDLNTIDLNSVERVEVVQGAAAASIYGAQGANGVIQLFSKRGKQGKISIEASSSISANTLINLHDNLHKAKFHSLETNSNNEVMGSGGTVLTFDEDLSSYLQNVIWNSLDPNNNNNKAYDKNLQWYDHNKMFFQTSYTKNNSISVSGGRDRVDFNLTASDNRQTTNFKGNGAYSRSNLASNIGVELFKNFRFRSITQLAYTHNTQVDPDGRTIMYALN